MLSLIHIDVYKRQKDYFLPAGDIEVLVLDTLSFEEFLKAADCRKLYEKLSLYGDSTAAEYEEIKKWFRIYCKIGGYPAFACDCPDHVKGEKRLL